MMTTEMKSSPKEIFNWKIWLASLSAGFGGVLFG